jgi:hypothetical protein
MKAKLGTFATALVLSVSSVGFADDTQKAEDTHKCKVGEQKVEAKDAQECIQKGGVWSEKKSGQAKPAMDDQQGNPNQ